MERRDITGSAQFSSTNSILGYLAAYGEFAPWRLSDADIVAQLGEIPAPFRASYRHTVFLARKQR